MPRRMAFNTTSIAEVPSSSSLTQSPLEVETSVGERVGLHVFGKFLAFEDLNYLYLVPIVTPFPLTNSHFPKQIAS
jgi:hypothetical protein